MNFPSDSKIWGPGVWFVIHVLGLKAKTMDKIKEYIEFVKSIIEKLPCDVCRGHALRYLQSNPLEDSIQLKNNDGEYIGMFKWSWTFHNAVNMRLGKQIINYDTALGIYENEEVCTVSCSSEPVTN